MALCNCYLGLLSVGGHGNKYLVTVINLKKGGKRMKKKFSSERNEITIKFS